jgi:hypothetical protein
MKISENTRVAKAGKAQAEVIIENVHLLYLNDNCLQYLNACIKRLREEFDRRVKNGGKHKKRKRK